jgi:hypothetical protein
MGEDAMGRRLTDLSGSSEFVNLMMEMQQQSMMLRNLTEKVQGFPELTRKVDVLVTQMEAVSKEVEDIEELKKLVDWHERLWKLIASICVLFFPFLTASVFWMWTQLSEVQSKQNIQEFKLQYMEKLNAKEAESANPTTSVDWSSGDVWYFDYSRISELSFHRVTMVEQQTEHELYSNWKVSVHF